MGVGGRICQLLLEGLFPEQPSKRGCLPKIEEVFTTLIEAKVLCKGWRREYHRVRLHSFLDYHLPAPEVIMPVTLTQKVVQLMG